MSILGCALTDIAVPVATKRDLCLRLHGHKKTGFPFGDDPHPKTRCLSIHILGGLPCGGLSPGNASGPTGQGFPNAPLRLALLAFPLLAGLLIRFLGLQLLEKTVTGNFTLQRLEGLFDIIITNTDLDTGLITTHSRAHHRSIINSSAVSVLK